MLIKSGCFYTDIFTRYDYCERNIHNRTEDIYNCYIPMYVKFNIHMHTGIQIRKNNKCNKIYSVNHAIELK